MMRSSFSKRWLSPSLMQGRRSTEILSKKKALDGLHSGKSVDFSKLYPCSRRWLFWKVTQRRSPLVHKTATEEHGVQPGRFRLGLTLHAHFHVHLLALLHLPDGFSGCPTSFCGSSSCCCTSSCYFSCCHLFLMLLLLIFLVLLIVLPFLVLVPLDTFLCSSFLLH